MSLLAQDTLLARKVGALAIALGALAVGFFVFVYDRIEWGHHVRVRVYFLSTGGLVEGAPFVVAGREVGSVESIALVPRGATKLLGDDEGVVATVAIDAADARRFDRGGDVFVASRGLLAGKYLELGPAAQPTRAFVDGDELRGRDPPSLDRVLQRTWDNLETVGRFAEELRPELEALRARVAELREHADVPGADRLGELVDSASASWGEVKKLREGALGGDAGVARIAALVDRGRAMVGEARAALAKVGTSATALRDRLDEVRARLGSKGDVAIAKLDLAIDRVRALIDKLDPLLAQVDALTASLARGDGSLMKLMHDPEFPEDAKELGKILKRHPWRVMEHPK